MSSQPEEEQQHENWKRNIPFMYEIAISHQLDWPSLTVQWLNQTEIDSNNNEVHRLLLSTLTNNQEQNYVHVAKVTLPSTIDQELDFTLLNNIWNTQDVGRVQIEFSIPVDSEANRIRYMPQNNRIAATQHSNGEIGILNFQLKQVQNKLKGQESEGYGLSWNLVNEGSLLSASYDSNIYLWDIQKESFRTFTFHEGEVEDVCWHPSDPNLFLSCSDDRTIAFCDIRTPSGVVVRQNAHNSEVFCIQFNPFHPQLFATASADSDCKLFDLSRIDKELHTFEYHQDDIYQLQWSPHQANIFATGSKDKKIVVWDQLRIGNEIKAEDEKDGPAELIFYHGGHQSRVNDLSWNPICKNLIASVEENSNILQIWKIQKQLLEEDENDQLLLSQI